MCDCDRMRFFDLYCEGKALPEEIDDYIDRWHAGEGTEHELYEFLGLTQSEYSAWISDASILPLILVSRKQKCNLSDLIPNHDR